MSRMNQAIKRAKVKMETITTWVDLDGVLVDLNASIFGLYGVKLPENLIVTHEETLKQIGTTKRDVVERLMDQNASFWEKAKPTPWMSGLVNILDKRCRHWKILTAAVRCKACFTGKFAWVEKNLGKDAVKRLTITCAPKEAHCHPGAVLIDDKQDNVDRWEIAKGQGFYWPPYSTKFDEGTVQAKLDALDAFLKAQNNESRRG